MHASTYRQVYKNVVCHFLNHLCMPLTSQRHYDVTPNQGTGHYIRPEKAQETYWFMVACLLMRKREWVVLGWAERCSHAPRAPNPRAENTGRTPGSYPCTIPSIQLHTCDVCTYTGDVEHNFQHPPCSGFLARENQEKAWTDILYEEEVKEDIDY